MFNTHTPYCAKNFKHLISQAFTYNMALKHIFGETPAIKMLDFLIDHRGYDYSKTEIAEHSGIGWTTINRHWRTLEEWNLVIPTRKIGRATLYKLNEENPIVSQLLEFDETTSTYMSERTSEQELRATSAIPEPMPAAAHSVA